MTASGMTDRLRDRVTRTVIDTGRPPHHAELPRQGVAFWLGMPAQGA